MLLLFVMQQPLRVVFDTNIYGLIAEEATPELFSKIEASENIIIYGLNIVRKELRDTPKTVLKNGRNFRNLLLTYYDKLTDGHDLHTTKFAEALAKEYLNSYSGGISKRKLANDFLIVACATLNTLDILVSDDNHSMFSKNAIEAYRKVNGQNGLKLPSFYSLKQLGKLL